MANITTSFIRITPTDQSALSKRFSIVSVSYKSWGKEERASQLPQLPTQIYKAAPVLSMVQEWKTSTYWVLIPHGETLALSHDALSIKVRPLDEVAEWVIRTLLVRALPAVLNADTKAQRFEADGLYYVVGQYKLASRWDILTTVRVDPRWSRVAGHWHLDIETATFSPLAMHTDQTGNLRKDVIRKPRYNLDFISQEINRSANGDFIKKSPSHKRKNRVPAVELQSPFSLESYYQTRLGVLSMFLDDMKEAYGDAIKISSHTIQPDQHRRVNYKLVDDSYMQLLARLKSYTLYVTNYSDDPDASELLTEELHQLGLSSAHTQSIQPNGLNLLLVNPKEQYDDPETDPYRQAYRHHPEAIIQACYPDSLQPKTIKNVALVLVKELLIKLEVKNRAFMLDYPDLPKDAWFITSIRPNRENLKANDPWPMYYCSTSGGHLRFGELPETVKNRIWLSLDNPQKKQIFEGKERDDIIYWPESDRFIIAADTGAVCMPDYEQLHGWLREIDNTLNHGIPSELIASYCKNASSENQLKEVRQIVAANGRQIPADQLKTIGYQSRAHKNFHDYLTRHGYRLKAPFASWDAGVLQPMTGIWYQQESGFYAAGRTGSPPRKQDNFNHIYRADTGGEPIPDWFWSSLDAWHIRHKGATVFPFIFKHLREYAVRQAKLLEFKDSA